ncbi:hypothetical protein BDV30DRAFT_32890 [Aspergillus minisclerotigenes]|uniref:Uncharacterized protein n=1 Tax=Aspergillus minisclerotigenes TaxID=656917 RepID=A0A5N6JCI5_9EURO|nr:hypothetical protein BDV30DRAFT_32890 [Aspergillus minisclerotigenes]
MVELLVFSLFFSLFFFLFLFHAVDILSVDPYLLLLSYSYWNSFLVSKENYPEYQGLYLYTYLVQD